MNKHCLSASVFLMTLAYSAAAFADRHYFEIIGESIGHTSEEARDNAARDAETKCYLTWGQSSQEQTILVEEIQPDTGYWYVKLSIGCTVDD